MMSCSCYSLTRKLLVTAIAVALPGMAVAEPTNADLQGQIDALQSQVTALNTEVNQATEWKNPNTLIHTAGYADVGYVKKEGQDGSFVVGRFAPIFHYQYRDIVMLEAELEFEVGEDGETEVALEYLTIDWFLNDYAVLVAGKFLSPIGQFRQNLHPSWINKLATPPPGFGHDGAAPVSDLGLQVRGGFPFAGMRANYAIYASNGPEINAETEDGIDYELDGVAAEGFNADVDGEKTFGGRFAILPVASVEVAVSVAGGKATVTNVEGEEPPLPPGTVGPVANQTARDYSVYGADFVWFTGNMSVRGEFVKTKVGNDRSAGVTASDGATWQTWYTQVAYRLPNSKWEGALRYTDYDSPHDSVDIKQAAIGLNYLVTNTFIVKLTHEFNEGKTDQTTGVKYATDDDLTVLQLAYGF
ncbi:MAG: hypothetical protein JKX75_01155 [Gammaproteobacteria bacterium]|nr:hypothetical protein [Gammaproteobacteria bacterium]